MTERDEGGCKAKGGHKDRPERDRPDLRRWWTLHSGDRRRQLQMGFGYGSRVALGRSIRNHLQSEE